MGMTDSPTLRSWELAALALTAADVRNLEAAERYAHEAVTITKANGDEAALESHLAYLALAETLRRRGRFDEAHDHASHALRITNTSPGSIYQAFALIIQAQLDLSSSDRRGARTHATAARQIIDRYPDVGQLDTRLADIEAALKQSHRRHTPWQRTVPSRAPRARTRERRLLSPPGSYALTFNGRAPHVWIRLRERPQSPAAQSGSPCGTERTERRSMREWSHRLRRR